MSPCRRIILLFAKYAEKLLLRPAESKFAVLQLVTTFVIEKCTHRLLLKGLQGSYLESPLTGLGRPSPSPSLGYPSPKITYQRRSQRPETQPSPTPEPEKPNDYGRGLVIYGKRPYILQGMVSLPLWRGSVERLWPAESIGSVQPPVGPRPAGALSTCAQMGR